jgi:hypothetical protein
VYGLRGGSFFLSLLQLLRKLIVSVIRITRNKSFMK